MPVMPVIYTVVIGAILGVIAWLWGPQLAHAFALFGIGGAAFLIFAAIVVALLVLAFVFKGALRGIAVAALGLTVVLGAITGVRFNYDVNSVYAAEAKVVTTAAPDFAERAPYDVATASSTKNLGDTTGEAYGVKILADESDHGIWTALVQRRGFMAGYEAVQSIDIPLYGTAGASVTSTCDFDIKAAGQRIGGALPHVSLDYKILGNTPPNVAFDTGDAYSYCDNERPVVVVPLKQLSGFWIPTWSSYGVAVYDGDTGDLEILTNTKDVAAVPGPVYPQSLAVTQRAGLTADGSFGDYFFNRSGYEDTAGDEGDPNGNNRSEFSLRLDGTDEAAFVTPLTPRGDSTSVIAMGVTDGTTLVSGQRNPLTVYAYPEDATRSANSSVAAALKSDYSFMPDWASGLTIFEMVPGVDGTWVASIGQTQSVVYRAVLSADGSAVLYDAKGREVTRANASDTPADGDTVTTPAADSDLTALTPAELRELAAAILDELTSRAR